MTSLEDVHGAIVFLCVGFSCSVLLMAIMLEYLNSGLTRRFYRTLVVSVVYTTVIAAVFLMVGTRLGPSVPGV